MFDFHTVALALASRRTHVVWIELEDRGVEYDATSFDHAHDIAMGWINSGSAKSASIRTVNPDGSINTKLAWFGAV